MYEAFVSIDPDGEKVFRKNYEELLDEINQVDSIMTERLSPVSGTMFAIYHPSLSYLAKDYNLHQLSLEYNGKEPSAFYLKKAIDIARENNVKVIFIQQEFDAKKAESKVKRWNAIAESAAKQSKRSILPQVSDVVTFAQAVKMAENCQIKLLPYECADGMEKAKRLIENITPGQDIAVFIGPEGGFDLDELELAKEAGCEIITLGKRILRTETAGMMLLSVLMYHLEQ